MVAAKQASPRASESDEREDKSLMDQNEVQDMVLDGQDREQESRDGSDKEQADKVAEAEQEQEDEDAEIEIKRKPKGDSKTNAMKPGKTIEKPDHGGKSAAKKGALKKAIMADSGAGSSIAASPEGSPLGSNSASSSSDGFDALLESSSEGNEETTTDVASGPNKKTAKPPAAPKVFKRTSTGKFAKTKVEKPSIPQKVTYITSELAVKRKRGINEVSEGKVYKSLKQCIGLEMFEQLPADAPTYVNIEAPPPKMPPKKYCDITGMPTSYTDPKTNMHFS
eukprot:CAMPEP_0184701286 /NCGR_PEP_ID=MMETSP0313-20130426/19108_1 /TAXON_ID=2792 /ORGANISM="Porphyridium aerugineum, Strain SAG 1380-2" /LENGTH=279 /DNA_ID=CAMNT_0027161289 /DNA_START=108 /DNA_END=944 /DNA_ORIENTATION=+